MTGVDTTTPVVVLGFHHGGLGVARSLGRWGVPVYAVEADPRAPALRSRFCARSWRGSLRDDGAEALLERLLRIAREVGGRPVLVPTADDGALFVAEHADALAEAYRFQRNPPETVRALCDKRELFHLARRLGVPTPETVFPRSADEVAAFARDAAFPVMLKGIDGLRLQARTGEKMRIATSPAELLRGYAELEDPESPNLMLQEYIPGGDDTIWMFNGYFDRHSECRAAFTGKKLRQHPVHTGATSLGICLENEEVARLTTSFMRRIGYQGVLDIGWRWDARDGSYRLLDPNPRIGATFRLFVGRGGMDVARFLYLDLTGQPLPAAEQHEGRKWWVEDRDLESSLDYAREGSLSLGAWVRSFRGVEEAAWWAADDPAPFRQVAAAVARRGAAAVTRRLVPRRGRETRAPAPVVAATEPRALHGRTTTAPVAAVSSVDAA